MFLIAGLFFYFLLGYKADEHNYSQIKDKVLHASPDGDIEVDIAEVEEYVGASCYWIMVPDTSIDYPLVQYKDNDYYLTHDAYNNESRSGAIFINYANSFDLSDAKTIIYGHNMKNGSMFHDLRYFSDQEYAASHDLLYIYGDNGVIFTYRLICSGEFDRLDSTVYDYEDGENMQSTQEYLLSKSDLKYSDFTTNDRLLILSTCINSSSKRRVVVFQQIDIS